MSRGKQIFAGLLRAIALAVLVFAQAGAAYALTCTSTGSANWDLTSTWSCGRVPLAADDVVIASGHSVTVNVAAVCNSFTTSGASSSGVVISASQSLTVSGNATLDGTNLNNNNDKSINVGAGTLSIGGALTLTGGVGNRTATLSISTGSATVSGGITGTNASSFITFSGAGTLNLGGGLSSGAMFTPGTGTVVYNGTGAQDVGAYTYNHLTVNKSAGTATLSGTATVNGNLTLSAGTLDLSTFTADRATSGGAISVASGATLKIGGGNTFPANYTTRTLGAASVVDYSGTSQTVSNEAYAHLNLSGSGTKSLPATAMTVAGNLTLAGTASADTGAAVTVNGNLVIGTGTTFLGNSYTHNVKGDFSNSGTLTGGTSTFSFSGTAAQSVSGTGTTNFYGLTIANAAGVTAGGSMTVRGNFTNSGTFSAGTSTLAFGGTAAQSLTGATTFNNLTMNNSAGLTINSVVSVSGTLTLTAGNVSTGANALAITSAGSVSRSSGHVVGNLRKYITTGMNVTQTFEIGTGGNFTPVTVIFDSVTAAGDLTATTATPDHPQLATSGINPAFSVNRYWTLSKDASLAYTTFGAVFTFVAGDVDSGSNTANFIVQRYVAPTWYTTVLVSPLATSTEAANIGDMGAFAVGQSLIVSFSREKEFVFTRELY